MNAVYGEEVRGSIHDAIDIINKVGEKNITLGTAVNSSSSSGIGYYDGSLYLNVNTYILWKYNGSQWVNQGNLKGAQGTPGTNGTNGVDGAPGAKIGIGTAVTSTNTSVTIGGVTYIAGDYYINNSSWVLWKCNGSSWSNMGVLKPRDGVDGTNGTNGVSPTISSSKSDGVTTIVITDVDGPHTFTLNDGTNGLSPTIGVSKSGGVTTLSVTDTGGTTTSQILDGVSPTIEVSKSGKVTTITITDVSGPHVVTLRDGDDGAGTGDMLMTTYDDNRDGIVNAADSVPWSGITNKATMTGATASTAGTMGLVPAPAIGDQDKVLKGDGTWGALSTVATSGSYNDLSNKPTIPSITASTDDLTPGTSQLATGSYYFVYE